MNSPRLPPKKDVAVALLEKSSVYVHLDPRHEGVRVPPWLKQRVPLVLQVGLNMAVAIPDLDVGDDAISCTLSFQRRPFFCFVPWAAVFALVGEDQRGMVWPDDVPPEVAAQAQKQQQVEKRRAAMRQVPSSEPPTAASEQPRAVETESSEPARVAIEGERPEGQTAQDENGKRAPHLAVAAGRADTKPELADASREEEAARVGSESSTSNQSAKDEEPKKGRTLPPYLRVVK